MKKNEIEVGKVYLAKVNNKVTKVRVDSINEYNPRFGGNSLRPIKSTTRYVVTNLATGRTTVFRSATKFRGVAS